MSKDAPRPPAPQGEAKASPPAGDGKDAAPAAPAAPSPAPPQAPGAEYFEQLLRLKAEFENYRKRVDRERPEWVQSGRAALLDKLLPLYDVLLQAHAQVAKLGAGEANAEIVTGLELIFKEFTKVFESEGVQVIETVGQAYHYERHEALGFVETDQQPEGTVVEELQRGYLLRGKVLRPARVRIAKAKQRASA